ncbi:MAG: NAD-dependent epimerase/dehydratase family protein [bacterium]
MRCLVTGGSGFFGTALVHRLLDAGASVRTLDLLPLPDPAITSRVESVEGDIRDQAAVERAVVGMDVVYHAAALVPITRAGRLFWAVNVDGTTAVLEAAHRHSVGHVVHISSSAVYGIPARAMIDEAGPRVPLGPYAHSKLESERVCEVYRGRGLAITILRPCTIIGPRRMGILELLFDWIHRGRPVYILGSGDNCYQLVSTRDMAEACVLAGTRGAGGEFNVGAGEFGTLREDLEALIHHAGTGSRIVSVPPALARPVLKVLDRLRLSPFVEWHYHTIDRDFSIDISKARAELGWRPVDSNAAMLCQAYDWYRTHASDAAVRSRSPHQRGLRRRLLHWLP